MACQLLLSYDFPPLGGGIARWMGELARRYPAGSLVVSTGQEAGSESIDADFPNLVDRLSVPSRRLRTVQGMVRWSIHAAALARNHGIEFVWCGNLKPAGYAARWIHARTGVPYGIMVHGGDLLILQSQRRSSQVKQRIARELLGHASAIVANSNWTRELCRVVLKQLRISDTANLVRVVPLGSDPVLFHPAPDRIGIPDRYGLTDQRRWLLSVARLTRHKGIDIGIRVVGLLRERYPDLGYAVVGSGNEQAALESLARELGVNDRVRFLGPVPDSALPDLYRAAEIYLGLSRLLPHRVEGFGISLLEAAASGIPVVASRVGGIPDAVREGQTGLLVEPDSLEEACQAVRILLDTPERAREMGLAGRGAVETYFNWDRVVADLSQIGSELGTQSTGRSHHGGQ